jgi:hypothetical protein
MLRAIATVMSGDHYLAHSDEPVAQPIAAHALRGQRAPSSSRTNSSRYALLEIFLRNFPVRIRCSRSILTRSRVLSLIAPVANISFIGVQ